MSFPLEAGEAFAVFALVAAGSCVQTCVGFGLGLIAAPLVFLIYPPLIPGPLMASSVVLTLGAMSAGYLRLGNARDDRH